MRKVLSFENIRCLINRETISYLICGILTTILALISFIIASNFGLNVALSNAISTILAVLFAYITNKIFVFRNKKWNMKYLVLELGKFCFARFITFLLETIMLIFFVNVLFFPDILMKMVTMFLVTISNYFLAKAIVFTLKSKEH